MVQIGWNAGPRHAQIFGCAKSFTRRLDAKARQAADRDVICALSFMWSFIRRLMPKEPVDAVEKALTDAGLPPLATRDIDAGMSWPWCL